MKKIIYTFLDLLTIAFLIGGYVFQYFTRKKLGMLRWVNYQNMQIQKNPVYDILKYITVAAAIVLIVLIIVGYRKKKELLGKIEKRMKNKKLWIFIGMIVLILILNHIFGWSSYLGNTENLKFLENMVQENLVLAIGIYTILTIISCVVLALPGVTFAIVAGLVFGPVLGTICCSVATTLGAMVAFVAGRFFLQDIIKPMAMKNKYLKKWLFDESGNNEVFILMITRLVPLFPYNLQNFAYGVTDIKFSTYSICSLIFMLPGTAMYTVGMAGLADKENRIFYIGIAIVLAGIVIGLGAFLKKHYVQEEKNEE